MSTKQESSDNLENSLKKLKNYNLYLKLLRRVGVIDFARLDWKHELFDKFDQALTFLAYEAPEAEDNLITFLLQFPDSEAGEDEIFSYFCNHLFWFYAQVPESEFMQDVLQALGDMHEDGGSHEYNAFRIIFWRQVRNALLKIKGSSEKFKDWKLAISEEALPKDLTDRLIYMQGFSNDPRFSELLRKL